MRISLIAALAENRVIGRDNELPWRISADLQHFKAVTMGKPIIMGRKTYASIGKPLPGRTNIVISRDKAFEADGIVVVHGIDQALAAAEGCDEVMVIGGANVYQQFLARAGRLYLTEVKAEADGDAWFPEIDAGQWTVVSREAHKADDKNEFDYDFVVLERT